MKNYKYLITTLMIILAFSFCFAGHEDSPYALNGITYFHAKDDPNIWEAAAGRHDQFRELGVYWHRLDFWWGVIEPEKGRFDWEFTDEVVRKHAERGVNLYAILCYGSAWSNGKAPSTDEERELFGRYVYNTVKRYKGTINEFEIWNEPNLTVFWSPQPDAEDYTKLLQIAYKQAKLANPDCVVAAPTLAGLDWQFMEDIYKYGAKGNFDVFSYHYYTTDPPEDMVPNDLEKLRQFFLAHGEEPKPVYITEFGINSHPDTGGVGYELQAARVIRHHLTALSTGMVKRIFYFTLQDWAAPDVPGGWDYHLGLTENNGTRKPLFNAYRTMVSELENMEFIGKVYLDSDIYCHLYKSSDKRTAVLWTRELERTVLLDVGATTVEETDIYGEVRTRTAAVGQIDVRLSGAPVYIDGVSGEWELAARFGFEDPRQPLIRGAINEMFVKVDNITDHQLRGKLEISGTGPCRVTIPRAYFRIAPGNEKLIKVNINVPLGVKPGARLTIKATANLTSGKVLIAGAKPMVINPFKMELIPPDGLRPEDQKVTVKLSNMITDQLSGKLRLELPNGCTSEPDEYIISSITPNQDQTYQFTLTGLSPDGADIKAIWRGGGFSQSKKISVNPFKIPMAKGRIAIDGDTSDWSDIPALLTPDGQDLFKMIEPEWTGAGDLELTVKTAWDEDYLYCLADVVDNKTIKALNRNYWDFDSLQMAIDPLNDNIKGASGFDPNDMEIECALTPSGGSVYISNYPDKYEIDPAAKLTYNISQKLGGNGVVYELAVPWELLGNNRLEAFRLISINFLVNDNDGNGRAGWAQITAGIGTGKEPGIYRDIILNP
jgi:Carbohydrate family 9 binding domain-like/Glycosyl hydrolase catalytic core/Beta-galactosidase